MRILKHYFQSLKQFKNCQCCKKAFQADGITVMQLNEAASQQTVYHLHFHIIPRMEGIELAPHNNVITPTEILEENAKKFVQPFKALLNH